MKTGLSRLLCFVSVLSMAQPALAQAKSAFEFKSIVAGQPVDMTFFSGCKQTESSLECSSSDRTVAGHDTFIEPSYHVVDGKLSSMFLLFEDQALPDVLSALSQKYGKPCKSETRKWQNKAGSTFDNPVFTWCFASGDLELHSMSIKRDYIHLEYNDRIVKKKSVSAKVDF